MFATRGVIFLDTPHESLVTLLEPEKAEEYLKNLSAFLRGKKGASSSMPTLVKELTDIDRAFESLQKTEFIHQKKAHVMGGPAVATSFSEFWTTPSASGIVEFSEVTIWPFRLKGEHSHHANAAVSRGTAIKIRSG
jgi:hypothetical protein